MKYLLIVILLFTSFAFADNKIPVKIVEIYDGDTIRAKINSENEFKIRLYGIDCYETTNSHRAYYQAYTNHLTISEVISYGIVSKKFLKQLSKDYKNASFEFRGIDKFGRALGILYLDDENINEKMINEGYCNVFNFKEK